jgi:hypothetical protein
MFKKSSKLNLMLINIIPKSEKIFYNMMSLRFRSYSNWIWSPQFHSLQEKSSRLMAFQEKIQTSIITENVLLETMKCWWKESIFLCLSQWCDPITDAYNLGAITVCFFTFLSIISEIKYKLHWQTYFFHISDMSEFASLLYSPSPCQSDSHTSAMLQRCSAASAGGEWGGQVSKIRITGRAADLLQCNLCHSCNQAAVAGAACRCSSGGAKHMISYLVS